jgi:hypothetical protein
MNIKIQVFFILHQHHILGLLTHGQLYVACSQYKVVVIGIEEKSVENIVFDENI